MRVQTLLIAASLIAAVGCDSSIADGEAVYNVKCITCHGANGTGEAETSIAGAADLNTSVAALDDAGLTAIIDNGSGDMLAVPMTADEKANLIAYLRATFE